MAKTKGAHVINAVRILRANKEHARKHLPPAQLKYLEERVLPATWYPFEDHRALIRALVMLFPGGDCERNWIFIGRGTAKMDLAGTYKGHLRPGDPEGVLRLLPAMWKSSNDSGELVVTLAGPGRASVELRDFPVRSHEVCGVCKGYLTEVLLAATGAEPTVTHERCKLLGDTQCSWQVNWRIPR